MTAALRELEVEAGTDWILDFDFNVENPDGTAGAPVPLTGYTIRFEVRFNSQTSADTPEWVASSVDTVGVPAELSIDAPNGKVRMEVGAARTLELPQVNWTKARDEDPKVHYTLNAIDPSDRPTFVLTGPLRVLVA